MRHAALLHLLGLEFEVKEQDFIKNVDHCDMMLRNHRDEMGQGADFGNILQNHAVSVSEFSGIFSDAN